MFCNIHFDDGEFLVRVEEFRAALRDGKVTADDGLAYWATDRHYCHEHPVFKSRRTMTPKPVWAVGIAWFPFGECEEAPQVLSILEIDDEEITTDS